MANETHNISKKNWVNTFKLVGKPKITKYTFKIDEQSQRSNWIYNSMNLRVDCGEKYGTIDASMMGGYSADGTSVIYCHGMTDDGGIDFDNPLRIDWDDRLNPDVLEEISNREKIRIGLRMTDRGNIDDEFYLSEYDAIKYLDANLREDMTIIVRGNLTYSMYNGKVQIHKEIKSIQIARDSDNIEYEATFRQSVLIDKYSASIKDMDKETGAIPIHCRVLDYIKEIDGVEVKGQYPYNVDFEYMMPIDNPEIAKKQFNAMFKVKKDITQITFNGIFVESGSTVKATWDDVPDDMKQLVESGVYTKEDVLETCSADGASVRKMILCKPYISKPFQDKKSVLHIFPERFTEDDLDMSWIHNANNKDDDNPPFDTDDSNEEDDDWLGMFDD